METRANYILIGAFALAGFLGTLFFFMWFARVEFDRQFAYYDIYFPTVAGLSAASDVRFSGLPVGQVVDVRLSREQDGRVRVRIEVDADTPIRTDSVATIESQGVTGVSYVGIDSGTGAEPLLRVASDDPIPEIGAGESVLQALSEDAPAILNETLEVIRDLRALIGGENQRRVETILENVETASAAFSVALEDFSQISGTVSEFAEQIGQFNDTLDTLTNDLTGVFDAAETTLESVTVLSDDAQGLIAQGTDTLARAEAPIAAAERYLTEDLGPATDQLRQSIADTETRIAGLAASAETMIATYAETGETANARLTEARATIEAANALIAELDGAVASIDAAAQRFDVLMEDDAQPLIAELRVATREATEVIRNVGEAAETDLPAIMADIRAATETASRTIDTVAADLTGASGRIEELTAAATETLEVTRVTFANANDTLSAINEALETGDRALAAAESAFTSADRVINEEAQSIAESLRTTLAELERTVAAVAQEIPGVTEDLRAASQSAQTAFAEIEGAVNTSAPAVREFAATALPQYARLAAETRALVENFDRLLEQISRDPGRFFLGSGTPEFRR
jgi:phospholipid/cholesterol/gamma-HCH transport system substrate-binding protein